MMTDEERKEYNKQYYEKNKDRILSNYAIKVTCKCGKSVSRANYFKHLDTKLHKNRIELNALMKNEE